MSELRICKSSQGRPTHFPCWFLRQNYILIACFKPLPRPLERASCKLVSPDLCVKKFHIGNFQTHAWDSFLKWKQEFHLQVHQFSDASNTGWGGSPHQPGKSPLGTRGYWDTTERKLPIVVKESLAHLRTLENLLHTHSSARIDEFVDNKSLLACWDKQVSKSPVISSVMKSIFQFVFKRNILLNLHYLPSRENQGDSPSRTLSDLDCSLAKDAWKCVETVFGPHSINLKALPENMRHDCSGRPLRFFSCFPCFQALGQTFLSSTYKLTKTLPEVPRVWTTAERCPQCAYPNEKTFNFCQQCGYRRVNLVGAAKQVKINLNAIDARLEALASRKKNKPYEKQSSLAVEFDNFIFFPPYT